jgi:hypothetical protein
MKFPKNKIKNKKTLQKMFGAPKKRKLKKYPKKVTKERVIKFIGTLSEKSKSILSPQKKKTSPKTLELQKAKTAKFTVEVVHDSIADGTYSNPERQEMKRERMFKKKPNRENIWKTNLMYEILEPVFRNVLKKSKRKRAFKFSQRIAN